MASREKQDQYQKKFYFVDDEWNVMKIKRKAENNRIRLLEKHLAHTKPWSDKWGACTKATYEEVFNKTCKVVPYDDMGYQKGHITKSSKKATVDIIKYDKKKDEFEEKTMTYYFLDEFAVWMAEVSAEKEIKILEHYYTLEEQARMAANSLFSSLPSPATETGTLEGQNYDEEYPDPDEIDDPTYDDSIMDLPNGMLGHIASKFIKKAHEKSADTVIYDEEKEVEFKDPSKYGADLSSNDDFIHLVRSRGIWVNDVHMWSTRFNRMQWVNPDYHIGPTREYLFFIKPDLHILNRNSGKLAKGLNNDPFWREMKLRYREVIQMLQYSAPKCKNDKSWSHKASNKIRNLEFIPILTNAVSSTLDLPDVSAETTETGQTIYGTTIQYRKGGWKSDEGYDFSLEFTDNQYLQLYHFFKMWEEYEKLKEIGSISPPGGKDLNPYRINKILHDQIGIFKFIVDEDMESIIYYAYLTGCFPKTVPRGAFNNLNPGSISYSIDWHAQFVDDMNPIILIHFNNIMRKQLIKETASDNNWAALDVNAESLLKGDAYKYVPIYNKKFGHINGGFRGHPIIGMINDTQNPGTYKYVLRWYDKNTKKEEKE